MTIKIGDPVRIADKWVLEANKQNKLIETLGLERCESAWGAVGTVEDLSEGLARLSNGYYVNVKLLEKL